ncbi:MAG: hypothetical protein R3Y56_01945 [Akkermansia sp.]
MIGRNYHCVNRLLYATSSLLVVAVCVYVLHQQSWAQMFELSSGNYQNLLALVAIFVTLLWGGYFLVLRYRVDEQGVSKRILSNKHLSWDEIADIDLSEMEQGGQAQLKLSFKASDGRAIVISSELLALEQMEELIADLREAGKLPKSESED